MYLIKNVKLFNSTDIIPNSSVAFKDDKIVRVFEPFEKISENEYEYVSDGGGQYLVPGYIDIHLHGCGGYDIMDNTEKAILSIAENLAKNGTTSFLPSTVTQSKENTQKTISLLNKLKGHTKGADILGIHLEGPFINPLRKGAQNPEYILKHSVAAFKDFVNSDLTGISRVTMAPEGEGGIELVKWLSGHGICVSCGHTCADFDTVEKAADNGLTLATHLFNGMNPYHHRDPGTVGASLLDDRIFTEFIADLIHLDKNTLKLIVKTKGADKCILITDSLSAALLGDGTFSLGGQTVIVKNKEARIESGSLAGSIITLKEAVRNMIKAAGVKDTDAFKMATENPAKVIGVDSFKGYIKPGYDADFNLLDSDYSVTETYIHGRKVK